MKKFIRLLMVVMAFVFSVNTVFGMDRGRGGNGVTTDQIFVYFPHPRFFEIANTNEIFEDNKQIFPYGFKVTNAKGKKRRSEEWDRIIFKQNFLILSQSMYMTPHILYPNGMTPGCVDFHKDFIVLYPSFGIYSSRCAAFWAQQALELRAIANGDSDVIFRIMREKRLVPLATVDAAGGYWEYVHNVLEVRGTLRILENVIPDLKNVKEWYMDRTKEEFTKVLNDISRKAVREFCWAENSELKEQARLCGVEMESGHGGEARFMPQVGGSCSMPDFGSCSMPDFGSCSMPDFGGYSILDILDWEGYRVQGGWNFLAPESEEVCFVPQWLVDCLTPQGPRDFMPQGPQGLMPRGPQGLMPRGGAKQSAPEGVAPSCATACGLNDRSIDLSKGEHVFILLDASGSMAGGSTYRYLSMLHETMKSIRLILAEKKPDTPFRVHFATFNNEIHVFPELQNVLITNENDIETFYENIKRRYRATGQTALYSAVCDQVCELLKYGDGNTTKLDNVTCIIIGDGEDTVSECCTQKTMVDTLSKFMTRGGSVFALGIGIDGENATKEFKDLDDRFPKGHFFRECYDDDDVANGHAARSLGSEYRNRFCGFDEDSTSEDEDSTSESEDDF